MQDKHSQTVTDKQLHEFPDSDGHFQQKSNIQLSRRASENVQPRSALQSDNKEVAVSVCSRTLGINYLLPPEPLHIVQFKFKLCDSGGNFLGQQFDRWCEVLGVPG